MRTVTANGNVGQERNGKPRQKPTAKSTAKRSMLFRHTNQAGVFVLQLNVGKDTDTYVCRIIPSYEGGRCFEVAKASVSEPDVYHVRLDGIATSCECKGFTYHQHCKHVDALAVLVERRAI